MSNIKAINFDGDIYLRYLDVLNWLKDMAIQAYSLPASNKTAQIINKGYGDTIKTLANALEGMDLSNVNDSG